MKKSSGYFLVLVLVFGSIAIAAVAGLVSFANANLSSGRRAIASEQALELAEAGIDYYRWHLAHAGGDYSDGGGAFPHAHNFYDKDGNILGTFNLTITPPQSGVLTIRSVGIPVSDTNVKRTVELELIEGEGVTFHYGVQSGNGGFELGNNATINGSVYSNGNISGSNGSSITGDASAVGTITNVNTGSSHPGAAAKSFPITDEEIQKWKDDAAVSTFIGNKSLSGTNNTLGPIKIQGNLTLNGNASLVVANTIWVTGNLTLGNDASISLSPSYGSQSGILVVDGTVSLGNNAMLAGSGTTGSSLMLVSLSSSSLAIDLGNGNTVSVILYAPNGTLDIGNNADIKALTAKTISLGNNVVLNYTQGSIDSSFTSGASGGWQQKSWKEIK